MTQTNTVTPKAGTLKQANGRTNLLRQFSKIASLLLMILMTVSTMALEQGDDSIGNGNATVVSGKPVTAEDSCCTVAVKSSGNFKALVYRVPNVEMIRKADSEVSHNFRAAVRKAERVEFSTLLPSLADAEMNETFNKENNVVLAMPAANLMGAADAEMDYNFAQDAAENISLPQGEVLTQADAEINSNFADANTVLATPDLTKADDEINGSFRDENKTVISVPNPETVAKSDAEMNKHIASEKQGKQFKSIVTVSNNKEIVK